MTVAATTRPPFADASPAEIRAALVAEEQGEFDRQYRRALEAAGASYSLDQLDMTLTAWRRVAWMTTAHGPEAYRRMLAKAEHTLRTGEPLVGSVPWDHVKAELGL
jgi:hypothetical protein